MSYDKLIGNKFDYLLKIVLIGESNVGKTALLTRYIDKTFENNSKATIGIDSRHKII